MKVLILGRGISGLSLAYNFSKAGHYVEVYGRTGCRDRASSLAQGIVCNKGLLIPNTKLFEYKLKSLDYIKKLISELNSISEIQVNHNFKEVFECFSGDFNMSMARIYKGEYSGLFRCRVERPSKDYASYLNPALDVAVKYPEEGWFNVSEFLESIEYVIKNRYQASVIDNHLSIKDIEKIRDDFDLCVISAGYKSKEILSNLISLELPLKAVSGQIVEFSTPISSQLNIVSGARSIIWSGRSVFVGSSSFKCENPSDDLLLEEERKLEEFARQQLNIPLKKVSNALDYGVRAVYKARNPVWNYIEEHKLLYLSGMFKNGLQIAPMLSEKIVEFICSNSNFTDFKS